MKITDVIDFFSDFYRDFDRVKGNRNVQNAAHFPLDCLKTLSKGTKEKVQLILTMSRRGAALCARRADRRRRPGRARLHLKHHSRKLQRGRFRVLLSTHLIADIERVLDEVVFLKDGEMVLHESVDTIREEHGKSVDMLFREVFAC